MSNPSSLAASSRANRGRKCRACSTNPELKAAAVTEDKAWQESQAAELHFQAAAFSQMQRERRDGRTEVFISEFYTGNHYILRV